jgi:2-dehydropantoate 2-reductase
MKIAVMGAGAVGCYYGGMLARAGREVVLIGRPQHVEAIRRDGLLMDTQSFREHVAVGTSLDAGGVRARSWCCAASSRPIRRMPRRKWRRISRPMRSC